MDMSAGTTAGTDIIAETAQSTMSMVGTIFGVLVFFIIFAVALQGLRRGLYRQLIHTGCVIISALIAFFICKGIWGNVLTMFDGQTSLEIITSLENSLETAIEPKTKEILVNMDPALFSYVLALPLGIIVFPFMFTIYFAIVNFIFWIIYLIVRMSLKLDRGMGMRNKLSALAIGAVEGIIVAVVVFLPFANLANVAEDVIAVSEESGGIESDIDLESLDPMLNNAGFGVVNTLGGKAIANSFTTVRIDGEKDNIREDAILLVKTFLVEFKTLENTDWNNLTQDDKDALESIKKSVTSSDYLSSVVSLALNGLAANLENNSDSTEIQPPLDQFMPIALNMIATSTKDNLETDIDTVLSVYYILSDSGVLTAEKDGKDPVDLLTVTDANGDTVITRIINVLNANSRTSALVTALTKYSLTLLAPNLGDDVDIAEVYDDVKSTINEDILSVDKTDYANDEEYIDALSGNLDTALKEHSIELEPEIVEDIAEYIDSEFISNGVTEVTDEQFNDIILSYYDYYLEYMNSQEKDAE